MLTITPPEVPRCPCWWDLSLRNRKNSDGSKSDEKGGCNSNSQTQLAIWTIASWAKWTGVVFWSKFTSTLSFSQCFDLIIFLQLPYFGCRVLYINRYFHFCAVYYKYVCRIKTKATSLPTDGVYLNIFRGREIRVLPLFAWYLWFRFEVINLLFIWSNESAMYLHKFSLEARQKCLRNVI